MQKPRFNIQFVKIGLLKENPNNPRVIKDAKFKALVESIKAFPEMLEIRPIVVNDSMVPIGGNQRLKACKAAGLKEVPIINAKNLTEAQQKEFVIKDNTHAGDWNIDELGNGWTEFALEDWGLKLPKVKEEPVKAESLKVEHHAVIVIVKDAEDQDKLFDELYLAGHNVTKSILDSKLKVKASKKAKKS